MSKNQPPRPWEAGRAGKSPARPQRSRQERSRQERGPRDRPPEGRGDGGYLIYGHHAVAAAILNPTRTLLALKATEGGLQGLGPDITAALARRQVAVEVVEGPELARLFPPDAVHQGLALKAAPLPALALDDVPALADPQAPALVLVLDHVTDPHNVGAMLRSAAAFGVDALVTTDRHTPGESGALAKAASGALELVPWVRVVNLSRSLEELAELGLWRVGLDGAADKALHELDPGRRVALVMGAEGSGLRHGTQSHCDFLARLPISPRVESLNVSSAAAVALYELARRPR